MRATAVMAARVVAAGMQAILGVLLFATVFLALVQTAITILGRKVTAVVLAGSRDLLAPAEAPAEAVAAPVVMQVMVDVLLIREMLAVALTVVVAVGAVVCPPVTPVVEVVVEHQLLVIPVMQEIRGAQAQAQQHLTAFLLVVEPLTQLSWDQVDKLLFHGQNNEKNRT
jgi:hypothetical protein